MMHCSLSRLDKVHVGNARPHSLRACRIPASKALSLKNGCEGASKTPAANNQHLQLKGFPLEVLGLCSAGVMVFGSLAGGKATAGGDLALGKQVFDANCAACHTGGGNTVLPDHTLQKTAINKFLDGSLNITAIVYQVQNGKNQMPAWEGTLEEEEIQAVASYVFDQAINDKW